MMIRAATIEVLSPSEPLGPLIARDLRDARRLSVAVAYAKQSALKSIDLEQWAEPGRELRLVAGTDFALTELELLRRLEPRPGVACRVYHTMSGSNFHPKLYVVEKESTVVTYVGSSNYTFGGLEKNIEANVRIEAPLDAAESRSSLRVFDGLFSSEFATPLSRDFESRYTELQEQQRTAQAQLGNGDAAQRLAIAKTLLLAQHRATSAARKHLLVVTPENYALCMRHGTWGHQNKSDIDAYAAGDLIFFHITGGRGIAATAMFTGLPFHDNAAIWQNMGKGSFPWRMRFVVLGELRTGIATKTVLEPLRPGAPKHWFHGYIQASHSLKEDDATALMQAFETALRLERGMDHA